MKLVAALSFFLLPLASSSDTTHAVQHLFRAWMEEFGRSYDTVEEFAHRLEVWTANHLLIESHNRQDRSYQLGHNQFSDWTADEFQQNLKLGPYSPGIQTPHRIRAAPERRRLLRQERPDEVDWVANGGVPPVKNQGMCGSCWAFSAIGAIEGAHFIDTGSLVALSEQQLIDCDKTDLGCGGGLMDNAFLFDEDTTGLCSEDDYPYAGHKHWLRGCFSEKGLCDSVEHTRVRDFIDVPNTVDALQDALSFQPVSVAIEADQQVFQFYKSGVFSDDSCGDNLDHGVLAVGYGVEDGQGYFKVRNSWGATWGDEGYIKMATESSHVNGTCGILSWASRPLLRDDQ